MDFSRFIKTSISFFVVFVLFFYFLFSFISFKTVLAITPTLQQMKARLCEGSPELCKGLEKGSTGIPIDQKTGQPQSKTPAGTTTATYNSANIKIGGCDEKFYYPWCGEENAATPFTSLVVKFYNIALWVVGVAALGAIVYGGILYTVSAGSSSKQQEAREWITGAISGLVLLLAATLILKTIGIGGERAGGKITLLEPGLEKVSVISPAEKMIWQTPLSGAFESRIKEGEEMGKLSNLTDYLKKVSGYTGITNVSVSFSSKGDCDSKNPGQNTSAAGIIKDAATTGKISVCNPDCECALKDAGMLNKEMLKAIFAVFPKEPFTVSSLTGGKHATTSLHYQGNAMDVVPVSGFPKDWQEVVDEFNKLEFKAFCEGTERGKPINCEQSFVKIGTPVPNAHVHIQVK